MRTYCVYIMSNRNRTTIYIGVTSNIASRTAQHKSQLFEGFTRRYHLTDLVYVERSGTSGEAIAREKQIKRYSRAKKNALIDAVNPNWTDISARSMTGRLRATRFLALRLEMTA